MTDIVTEPEVSRALKYLAETDEPCAKAHAYFNAVEHHLKVIKATEYLSADGTNGEREQKAIASQNYREHLARIEESHADLMVMVNKRKRAELTVEVWRSVNANKRRGNV